MQRSSRTTPALLLSGSAVAAGLLFVACTGDDPVLGHASVHDDGGAPDTSPVDGGPMSGDADSNGGDSGSTGDSAACMSESLSPQTPPLDMYIMLDQSGSMADQGKWAAIGSGMNSFATEASAAGVGVGLQYFGLTGGAGSCISTDYQTPTLEIAPLPGAATALSASLAGHVPAGDTPTYPALKGAVDHAKAWASAHTGRVTVVVLATDSYASSTCDDDLTHIATIASTAAAGTPRIVTFVIGVGSTLTNLNGIAAGGGTGQAILTDTSAAQFFAALNKVQGAALACHYTFPIGKDRAKLNISYEPAAGAAVTVGKVAGRASCPATGDAWYYDDNATPTQILLCDSTCKTVQAGAGAPVSILSGCSTVLK